jgi:hypothetical protein
MNKIKSTLFFGLLACFLAFGLSSCMTTKTVVGDYERQEGNSFTYAKSKQLWLFWGLIPLGKTRTNTPPDGHCLVITKHNFGDTIISFITGGILTSHTIKVKAKKLPNPIQPATK